MRIKLPKSGTNVLDETTKAMIYEGVNLTQIAKIFGMNNETIKERIAGIEPAGVRHGVHIYKIKDIYSRLAKLSDEEIENRMRTMHYSELPKYLSKEFWNGQLAKQSFEEKAGDLWPTTKVIEVYGDLFKLVRMQLLLMSDAVERSTELSDRQRMALKQLTDGTLRDIQRTVLDYSDKISTPPALQPTAPVESPNEADDDEL